MTSLPDIAVFSQRGRRFAVLHGGMSDVSRFLWPCSSEAAFAEEIELIQREVGPVDAVVAGHCGLPFSRTLMGVEWINAGVIGMPANDGQPATRCAALHADGHAVFRELCYDHASARAGMERVGLTQGYHTALETGYWPSEDVLPPELRRAAVARG